MKNIFLISFIFISTFSYSQNPNDCVNAIVLCSNSNIGLDPNGIGFDDFSLPGNNQPDCYFFDQHNIWFEINIQVSGTLTFDIIPDDGIADYDFAIFGPQVDCTTLGNSIRCSSTNPEQANVPANTGLNMTETDVSEGPGADGNGYLMYIDAQAGDTYYLLVDRAVGDNGFSINLTGTATLPNSVTANPVSNQTLCDTDGVDDGFTEFDLNNLIPTITGSQTNTTVTFHTSINDAIIGINILPNPYQSIANPQTVYARIESMNGCTDYTSFTLETGGVSLVAPNDIVLCSYNGSEEYILDSIIPEVLPNPTGYSFTYHETQNDADLNIAPLGDTVIFNEIPRTIYIRVTDENDPLCYNSTSFDGFINAIILASQPLDIIVCDDDFDGITSVTLTDKDAEILNGLPPEDYNISYYETVLDRENETNAINGLYENTSNPKTIYVRFEDFITECFDTLEFDIIVYPKPVFEFEKESYTYCLNAIEPLIISVPSGFQNYEWSTGETGPNLNSITINSEGTYSVTVTNEFGCTNSNSTTVIESNEATITGIIIDDFHENNNTVTIFVEGPGEYVYSLDNGIAFQNDNIFTGVESGYHTVFIKDINGCGIVSREIVVLSYPKFFTPNQDGIHDYWTIHGITEYRNAKVFIYNRYGKLLLQLRPYNMTWDGTYQGKPMPSSDYWFVIEMGDGRTIKGHFTLKR